MQVGFFLCATSAFSASLAVTRVLQIEAPTRNYQLFAYVDRLVILIRMTARDAEDAEVAQRVETAPALAGGAACAFVIGGRYNVEH